MNMMISFREGRRTEKRKGSLYDGIIGCQSTMTNSTYDDSSVKYSFFGFESKYFYLSSCDVWVVGRASEQIGGEVQILVGQYLVQGEPGIFQKPQSGQG
jgi:hypothetical protein